MPYLKLSKKCFWDKNFDKQKNKIIHNIIHMGPFMIGYQKKNKIKDFLELFFTHKIYMKQT